MKNLINQQWHLANYPEELPGGSNKYKAIYAVEYGDKLKIGISANLRKRINTFANQVKGYADIKIGQTAYTEYHKEANVNEKLLHKEFELFKISGTELFNMTLDEFLTACPKIKMTYENVNQITENRPEYSYYTIDDIKNISSYLLALPLFEGRFICLSNDARVLYAMIRYEIRIGCEYLDMQNIFTELGVSDNAAEAAWNELKNVSLIEEEKNDAGKKAIRVNAATMESAQNERSK